MKLAAKSPYRRSAEPKRSELGRSQNKLQRPPAVAVGLTEVCRGQRFLWAGLQGKWMSGWFSRRSLTQAAPSQFSASVVMEMAWRAAYPESHRAEGRTDGIFADAPAKTLVFHQMCRCF